jgi:hypothetical protein
VLAVGLMLTTMLGSAACEKTDDAGLAPPAADATDAGGAPDSPDSPDSPDAAKEPGASPKGAPDAPDAAAAPPEKPVDTRTKKQIAEDNALRKRPRAFTAADLDTDELTALLAAHPRTKRLAKDVSYYWDPQAGIRVLGRGTNDPKGFEFEALPKIWDPDDGTGAKFLLIMGRSGEDTSFIVVYRMTDESKATLASSFIMENEIGPLAFGFSQAVRRRVYFTSCWGCPGESGKVLLKDDGRVVIVQP